MINDVRPSPTPCLVGSGLRGTGIKYLSMGFLGSVDALLIDILTDLSVPLVDLGLLGLTTLTLQAAGSCEASTSLLEIDVLRSDSLRNRERH